jgi:hypothetical protein
MAVLPGHDGRVCTIRVDLCMVALARWLLYQGHFLLKTVGVWKNSRFSQVVLLQICI